MWRWLVVLVGCETTAEDTTDVLTIDEFPQVSDTGTEPTAVDHEAAGLELAVTYCVDASLTDQISREEVQVAFDLWDDLTVAEVFREDCSGPALTVGYDPDTPWTLNVSALGTAEIVLGQLPMIPQSEVDGGNCTYEIGFEYTLAHMLGHALGIGHSCESPADGPVDCTDEEIEALMSGITEPCATPLAVNDWDRTALFTLHGLAE